MSRAAVIDRLQQAFDNGAFLSSLARRVAYRTESQVSRSLPHLRAYLDQEIAPALDRLGYTVQIVPNPCKGGGPFLIARRIEDPGLPTVLTYGHGDVIRGLEGQWKDGRDPWTLDVSGERIYGRGVADNKGQHSINLAALEAVLAVRGRLGFNSAVLIETSEEIGSPGLAEVCRAHRDELAGALLLASDGPRIARATPTLFMGTRGATNLDLVLDLRESAHHSGNWGGVLANPGVILAHALASIVGADGRVKVRALLPEKIPGSVREALAGIELETGAGIPAIDAEYGEPGLTPVERLFAWNTFEVLAFTTGNPDNPVNAVPPRAVAHCQIRFTVDRDPKTFLPALRRHLDEHGFGKVEVREAPGRTTMQATRLDPQHPFVQWAAASIERTVGRKPAILPNLAGTLPNDCFAEILGMPTIYVPHSYNGCCQHAPDEHGLAPILREGLAIMGGLFWDLGDKDTCPLR